MMLKTLASGQFGLKGRVFPRPALMRAHARLHVHARGTNSPTLPTTRSLGRKSPAAVGFPIREGFQTLPKNYPDNAPSVREAKSRVSRVSRATGVSPRCKRLRTFNVRRNGRNGSGFTPTSHACASCARARARNYKTTPVSPVSPRLPARVGHSVITAFPFLSRALPAMKAIVCPTWANDERNRRVGSYGKAVRRRRAGPEKSLGIPQLSKGNSGNSSITRPRFMRARERRGSFLVLDASQARRPRKNASCGLTKSRLTRLTKLTLPVDGRLAASLAWLRASGRVSQKNRAFPPPASQSETRRGAAAQHQGERG